MVIDIIKIKQEEMLCKDFHFDYQADNSLILYQDAEFSKPVSVDAHIELDGQDVYADITINYNIVGQCARCLERAEKSTEYSFSVKFTLHPEDDEEYLYKGGKVDLEDCVKEAILLSQPSVIYCREDCKGLCPVCGANLNKVDCGHNNKVY